MLAIVIIIAFQNFIVMIESWWEQEENWKKLKEISWFILG